MTKKIPWTLILAYWSYGEILCTIRNLNHPIWFLASNGFPYALTFLWASQKDLKSEMSLASPVYGRELLLVVYIYHDLVCFPQ